MVVRFENCELKIDQIQKEEFSQESLALHEVKVLELIRMWLGNERQFTFRTSGSTGKAKTILIDRKKIDYSCESTMQFVDPDKNFSSMLLCLDPELIGGAMVVFRALHRGLDLTVQAPSSNPLKGLNTNFDMTSLVPMQLKSSTETDLDKVNTIFIGGAATDLNPTSRSKIYATFGMTETVSHFALRRLGDAQYNCVGDAKVDKTKDDRLIVKGSITDHKALITNDIIDLISPTQFEWIGRADLVINSGGYKVNPEKIERQISNEIHTAYFVTSLPDEVLGEKVVLVVEGSVPPSLSNSQLSKFERPREIHCIKEFCYTPSQKIDRNATKQRLLEHLK